MASELSKNFETLQLHAGYVILLAVVVSVLLGLGVNVEQC